MTAPPPAGSVPRFEHPAFFYRSHRDYLTTILRFLHSGLAADEPTMVAVPTGNLAMLEMALGGDATRIEMHDMTVAGRNPGRLIGGVLLDFVQRHRGDRLRIVGEPIWASRDATEYPACVQHEALINDAFDGVDATILCPYNTSELPPRMIMDAKRTHPVLWTDTERWASAEYDKDAADEFTTPLPPVPLSALTTSIYPAEPGGSRRFTASFALAVGLDVERIADAVLAVDELVSNTITHGGGYGQLAAWTDERRAVFEVSDAGYIDDRLAGRRLVDPTAAGGRGLALVHAHSDLVRMFSSPKGTAVRAYFNLS
jgi:anti-sigma regulatory factor (Ser/Thr protein kinase)